MSIATTSDRVRESIRRHSAFWRTPRRRCAVVLRLANKADWLCYESSTDFGEPGRRVATVLKKITDSRDCR